MRGALIGVSLEGIEPLCNGNTFPSGLLKFACDKAQELGIKVILEGWPSLAIPPRKIELQLGDKLLRPYQVTAISRMMAFRRGLICLGTGGGKTEVYLGFLKTQQPNSSLFLVPSDDARTQAIQRGNDVGLAMSLLPKKPKAGVHYVTTTQYVNRNAHRLVSFLRHLNCICFDEAHHLGTSETHQKIAQMCKAPFRFGLTATPFTDPHNPFKAIEDLRLIGWLGEPLIHLTIGALTDMGYTERPIIYCVQYYAPALSQDSVSRSAYGKREVDWHKLRKYGLAENVHRNRLLLGMLRQIIGRGRKPLLLIDLVKQGKDLFNKAFDLGLNVAFCKGARETWLCIDGHIRRSSREAFAARFHELQGVIATSVFDEAVDMPDLTDLILGGGGKGGKGRYTKTIQRAGRALRKSGSPHPVRIYLPMDNHHGVLRWHSICQRRALEQEGFNTTDIKVVYNDATNKLQVLQPNPEGNGVAATSEPSSVTTSSWVH